MDIPSGKWTGCGEIEEDHYRRNVIIDEWETTMLGMVGKRPMMTVRITMRDDLGETITLTFCVIKDH
jgi:hypothetical protein